MAGGFDIAQLKGTPLYALAQNANIYGGKDLSRTEMVFFKQQCREMGFDPAKYGLEIESEDLEGANPKETQKNAEAIEDAIKDIYKGQFGKKGIEPAKMAETKAYSMIKVAKEAFERNHRGVQFAPENLGLKPNVKDPQYKDNLTKYAVDLQTWAQDVCTQYNDADHMSNEQLAAYVIASNNANTAVVIGNNNNNAQKISDKIDNASQNIVEKVVDQGAETRRAVHNEGAATRRTVKNEAKALHNHITDAESNLHDHLIETEYNLHDHMIDAEYNIRSNINSDGNQTRQTVMNGVDKTIQEVKDNAQQTQELNGISDNITTTLSHATADWHTESSINRLNNMRNTILHSNATFEQRRDALNHLANFAGQQYMNDEELANEEAQINRLLNQGK